MNGIFSHLIDDKLSIRYLLLPFSEYLPKYYFHISVKGILHLIDCPNEYNADNIGVIKLLKDKGALATKPLLGSTGHGFIKLAYTDGEFLVNDQQSSEREITKMIDNWRLSNFGHIITEFLIPHPDIRRIWDKTTNSMRITVIRGQNQIAWVAQGFTKFGNRTTGTVDNIHAGGIFSYLDVESGIFCNGKRFDGERIFDCKIHPDTGIPVEGTIPAWKSITEKLIEISDFIPQLCLMGFDLVVVEDGFKIIEINSLPGMRAQQMFMPINKNELMKSFFEEKIIAKKNLQQKGHSKVLRNFKDKFVQPGKVLDKLTKKINLSSPDNSINEHMSLIRHSGLYKEDWYLDHYPDVREAGIDPLRHYLTIGAFEGRNPSPEFSSSFYLNTFDDVKNEGINPLLHYLKYGKAEGRMAHPGLTKAA